MSHVDKVIGVVHSVHEANDLHVRNPNIGAVPQFFFFNGPIHHLLGRKKWKIYFT